MTKQVMDMPTLFLSFFGLGIPIWSRLKEKGREISEFGNQQLPLHQQARPGREGGLCCCAEPSPPHASGDSFAPEEL